MLEHIKAMNSFLEAVGWQNPRYLKMRGDASKRVYYRLKKQDKTAILVYSPPDQIYPFIKIAQLLRAKDYSAPKIYASDPAKGFMLLEDLGDCSFKHLLENPSTGGGERLPNRRQLYTLAVNVLVDLARDFPLEEASCFLATYDDQAFAAEHNLLTEWAFKDLKPAVKGEFTDLWSGILPDVLNAMPSCMVLRDYHVDNLMYIASRQTDRQESKGGNGSCGLLDFQDALCGPVGYDLASLLDDIRYRVPEELKTEMLSLAARGYRLNINDLKTAVEVLSAQRLCKIIGIFTRLAERDNKPNYLDFLPFTWELLEQKLNNKSLAPMKSWFDKYISEDMRAATSRR